MPSRTVSKAHVVRSIARYVVYRVKLADEAVWRWLARWGSGGWTVLLTVIMLILMVRQTVVIEKQDEILGRRAKLAVVITKESQDATGVPFGVAVQNVGKKGAQNFYYTLLIPKDAPLVSVNSRRDARPPLGVVRDIAIDGVTFRQYRDFFPLPLYPNIPVDVAEFKMGLDSSSWKSKTIAIRWRVSAEDGVFPDPDVPGTFTFTYVPPVETQPAPPAAKP